jgi:hypothetical protein
VTDRTGEDGHEASQRYRAKGSIQGMMRLMPDIPVSLAGQRPRIAFHHFDQLRSDGRLPEAAA